MDIRLWIVITCVLVTDSCKNVISRNVFSYKLTKLNAKSQQDVMTRRRVANVAKCKDFAESKNALAFNFERSISSSSAEANCVLYGCPEVNGLPQLINATGVDYYSSYKALTSWRKENVSLSCVEKIGLFAVFTKPLNFTNARAACHKIHGFLADVTSESRSRGLAALLHESPPAHFVGLSNEHDDRHWKNELGDSLACFDYRAWDSGEPTHSRGCVGLLQANVKKLEPIWRVMSCKTELPYVCEIARQRVSQPKL